MNRMLKQAELLGIVFFLSGCATTSIPTLTTAVPPPLSSCEAGHLERMSP